MSGKRDREMATQGIFRRPSDKSHWIWGKTLHDLEEMENISDMFRR